MKKTIFHIFLIAVFAFLVMSSAFYNGLPGGNDLAQHFQFAKTIHHSIISGEFYPSLASHINQGFGDYGIRFYPPLAYYLLSISFIAFEDWFYASLFSFFFIFWISGVGTYFWAKEEFPANQSLLAAALFIFAPYHINQIYNGFLLAEFASTAVLPFCFLFITRVCRNGKLQDILGLSVVYALLILTHLPLTILGSLSFAIYGLILLPKGTFFKTLLKLFIAVSISITASSFYWLKMIAEKDWLNHSTTKYFSTIYSYHENFLFRPQNILNFYEDVTCLWLAELMLAAVLLIAIPAILFFIKEKNSLSRFNSAIGIIFFFSLFMVSPLSSFIWNQLDFLQKVQFPWRWLGIISLSGSIFASGGILKVSERLDQRKNTLLLLSFGIILTFYVFCSVFIVKQAHYLPQKEFQKQVENLFEGKSFDCWWMSWMKTEAFTVKEKAISEGRTISIKTWNPLNRTIVVSEGHHDSVQISTYYYPHWKASVNGQFAEVTPSETGLISIAIPPNESIISLTFEEPFINQVASYISIVTWVGIFLLLFLSFLSHTRRKSEGISNKHLEISN